MRVALLAPSKPTSKGPIPTSSEMDRGSGGRPVCDRLTIVQCCTRFGLEEGSKCVRLLFLSLLLICRPPSAVCVLPPSPVFTTSILDPPTSTHLHHPLAELPVSIPLRSLLDLDLTLSSRASPSSTVEAAIVVLAANGRATPSTQHPC